MPKCYWKGTFDEKLVRMQDAVDVKQRQRATRDHKATSAPTQDKREGKTAEQELRAAKQPEPVSAIKQQLSFRDTHVTRKQVPLIFLLALAWAEGSSWYCQSAIFPEVGLFPRRFEAQASISTSCLGKEMGKGTRNSVQKEHENWLCIVCAKVTRIQIRGSLCMPARMTARRMCSLGDRHVALGKCEVGKVPEKMLRFIERCVLQRHIFDNVLAASGPERGLSSSEHCCSCRGPAQVPSTHGAAPNSLQLQFQGV